MLIDDVRPTTIEGVKSLASQLRRERRIRHSAALDLAARAADCTNFRNAQRTLPARGRSIARPYVLLTGYWRDADGPYRIGRETMRVELQKPILEICDKSALKTVRGFGDLRVVADDHLVCDALAETRTAARERLCAAQRSLHFMEQTGLRPSRDRRRAKPDVSPADRLPDSDHATHWVDPAHGQYIVVDEPYHGVPDQAKRSAWAARTGWRIAKTSWPGMYNPFECDLYVVTDGRSGYDLESLVARIDGLAAPLLERDWSGESSSSWDTFISPMANTAQDRRRARCRGTVRPIASATTVPCSFAMGSPQRRPAGELGVDGHVEAGRIIKAILRADLGCNGVDRRMGSLRSTLEDWMSLEIGRGQLEGPEFFEVYYREAKGADFHREMARSHAGIIAMLGDLGRSLRAAYPDCGPLRRQLRRIDASASLIGR